MALPKYLRHFRHQKVRASAVSAVQVSAALPDSGIVSAQNSQVASAAAAQLAQALDDTIKQFDLEGEPSDQLRFQLDQLSIVASKYSNSQLDLSAATEWQCTLNEARLIFAANCCASVIYNRDEQPKASGIDFGPSQGYLAPSATGTSKATGFWVLDKRGTENMFGPVVIVSIRGTASVLDAMVNLNGQKQPLGSAICLDLEDENGRLDVHAHAGFLQSAEALLPQVCARLSRLVKEFGAKHVLFTGHSAGGAVASLLCSHFLCKADPEYESIRFSLITFGSPPVTDVNLTPNLLRLQEKRKNAGHMLAIANEYDAVVRADRSYLLSLIELYQSAGESSLSATTSMASITSDSTVDTKSDTFSAQSKTPGINREKTMWQLPPPEYHHIGEIVLLKVSVPELSGTGEFPALSLTAMKVHPMVLSSLVFCDTAVHSRVHYTKRAQMILDGKFNNGSGWQEGGNAAVGWRDKNAPAMEDVQRLIDSII